MQGVSKVDPTRNTSVLLRLMDRRLDSCGQRGNNLMRLCPRWGRDSVTQPRESNEAPSLSPFLSSFSCVATNDARLPLVPFTSIAEKATLTCSKAVLLAGHHDYKCRGNCWPIKHDGTSLRGPAAPGRAACRQDRTDARTTARKGRTSRVGPLQRRFVQEQVRGCRRMPDEMRHSASQIAAPP